MEQKLRGKILSAVRIGIEYDSDGNFLKFGGTNQVALLLFKLTITNSEFDDFTGCTVTLGSDNSASLTTAMVATKRRLY